MYKIIALIGESGSGKDTLLNNTVRLFPRKFHKIVRTTTRPKREHEQEGKPYHFLSNDEFNCEDMIEHSLFNVSWQYGTSYSALKKDKINIGAFDLCSLQQLLMNPECDVTIVRVCADDKKRIMRQLKREKHPDVHEIVRRAANDFVDFSLIDFDFNYEKISNKSFLDLIKAPWKILLGKFD